MFVFNYLFNHFLWMKTFVEVELLHRDQSNVLLKGRLHGVVVSMSTLLAEGPGFTLWVHTPSMWKETPLPSEIQFPRRNGNIHGLEVKVGKDQIY